MTTGLNPLGLEDEDAALFPDDQRRLVTFIFRLPIRLPVPDNHFWTLEMGGSLGASWDEEARHVAVPGYVYAQNMRVPFVQLRAWQVKRERPSVATDGVFTVARDVFPGFGEGAQDTDAPTPESGLDYETIVEAVTQGARTEGDDTSRPIGTTSFDRVLKAMNEVLEALSGATTDLTLAPVARELLGPIALVGSRPAVTPTFDVGPLFYWLNWNVDAPPEPVDEEVLMRTLLFISTTRTGQPLRTYLRLARRASASLASGDYTVSVLMAAASGEVLLNVVLRALIVEEGQDAEIAAVFGDQRGGLLNRLRGQYARRLGGRWALETWETAPGHWEQSARQVRHRVIHSGHSPTMDEAVESLHGVELLESFVKDRVASKRYQYPKTALTLLGVQGLEMRGFLNGRMRRLILEVEPVMPTFWAAIVKD